MALHLLLFTSDAQIALILGKLLSEFDIEVEFCSDALASVEKVTQASFDAILVDWDDGPEATFLLKTARELKTTRECLALALVSDAAAGACAVQIGAHGILHKPIVPEQVREAMGTIREMMLSRQATRGAASPPLAAQLASPIQSAEPDERPDVVESHPAPPESKPANNPRLKFLSREPRELPSLPPMPKEPEPPAREASVGTIFSSVPYVEQAQEPKVRPKSRKKKKKSKTGARILVMAGVLLAGAIGYVWAPGSSYWDRVTTSAKALLASRELQTVALEAKPSPASEKTTNIEVTPQQAQDDAAPNPEISPEPTMPADDSSSNIQVNPVVEPSDMNTGAPRPYQPNGPVGVAKAEDTAAAPVAPSPGPASSVSTAPVSPNPVPVTQPASVPVRPPVAIAVADHSSAEVPQSLKFSTPINPGVSTDVAPAPPPAIGSALTTIVIPEEVAKNLLVKKIQPPYPPQALHSGVQGAVVLQAWIARDGTVRDVKLLRGSFVLARSAVDAVKQWQYKPYSVNGQAVEVQTQITVSFKLPNGSTTVAMPPASGSISSSDSPKP